MDQTDLTDHVQEMMVNHATGKRNGMATRLGALAAVVMMLLTSTGCEWDSFMDPSRTGRFEFEPTTIPVLERLDLIEPREDIWARATPPTEEDLMPRDLAYFIYPGDVVTTSIFELQQPSQWTVSTRRVDAGGMFRIPEIGDVRAAGMTPQQFEEEVKRVLRERVMPNPQVDVVVEQGGGLRYTVYGYINRTSQYMLDNPNLRLIEALANAGGVPLTTERVYIIRQVVVSPEAQPGFQRDDLPTPADSQQPTQPDRNIDDLIRDLEGELNADVVPAPEGTTPEVVQPDDEPALEMPTNAPPMVDIDELEPVREPEQPPVDVDVVTPPGSDESTQSESFIYIPERGEWVRVPRPRANGDAFTPEQPVDAVSSGILTRTIVIDYQRLSRGDSSQNIVVRPGDTIYVDGPEQGFFYIDGEVNRIGVYQLPQSGTLTLSRAITSAGGFGPIAIPSRVDLTRTIGNYREATIRLDVAAIRQRTEPDVVIKADDHIIVGTSWYATPLAIIRSGFRATYGFGFLLDRNFGNDVFGAPPGEGSFF